MTYEDTIIEATHWMAEQLDQRAVSVGLDGAQVACWMSDVAKCVLVASLSAVAKGESYDDIAHINELRDQLYYDLSDLSLKFLKECSVNAAFRNRGQ